MRLLSTFILLIALAATVVLAGPYGEAEAQERSDKLTLFIVDRESISSDQATIDLVNSLLGLMFQMKEGQPFAVMFGDDLSEVYGPLDTGAEDFTEMRRSIEEKLASPPPGEPLNLVSALAEMYNHLKGLFVSPETTIYFITGDTSSTDAAAKINEMGPVLSLVGEAGWSVSNVTTPETDPGLKAVLSEIAQRTSGESFELSIPHGLEEIANRTLIREGKGPLQPMGDTMLSPDSIFGTDLDVVPGTGELNLIFFREDDVTSLSLKNPSGTEASSGDLESSSTIELPNVVMLRLVEPTPGRWSLEVRGDGGLLSASRYSINRYRIELQMYGAAPVGMPVNVVASVTDDGSLVSVDAGLLARITDPNGTSVLYDLNDEGTGGDAIAGDGYYSATLPSLTVDGTYSVEMQIQWPEIAHTITTLSSFDARLFPEATFVPEPVDVLDVGAQTKIGEILVNVGSQPFAVSTEDLSVSVATNQGDPGNVEIVPQRLISEGRAFEFDVFYTAVSESMATMVISMDVDYAGRQFSRSIEEPVIVSSIPPAQPLPTPRPPATPAPAPTTAPPPPVTPAEETTGASVIVAAVILALLGAAVIALLVNWLTRTPPFGTIYTERGNLVVRFRGIERPPMNNLLTRNIVPGEELAVQGFEGILFRFGRDSVTIEPTEEVSSTTVRLNNQPITELTELHDGSWIGAMGRLYLFSFEDAPPEEIEDETREDDAEDNQEAASEGAYDSRDSEERQQRPS